MNKINAYLLFLAVIVVSSCAKIEPQDPEEVLANYKNEVTIEGKLRIFEEFKRSNPDDKLIKSLLSNLTGKINSENGIHAAADFIEENAEYASSQIYNSLAWKIFESGQNLEKGAELAKSGVEAARKELEEFKEAKTENLKESDNENSLKQSLAMVLDTYGCIEKELGNVKAALPSFKEAVELMDGKYGEVNENYISALIDQNKYKDAKSSLEEFIISGNKTDNMKEQLKEVYSKLGGEGSDFSSYYGEIRDKAREKMTSRLKDEIINVPAEDFELYDLSGKLVKLSDYKGKTVILDFWATWCGPCRRSFPGMKKAVNKYSNSNVKFLFVNTRERVENKKQNAEQFIAENDYPFHVLMDEENEVVEKYSVRGIPTKFIIDKNQNIRFESIGFIGNEEDLVDELSIMISMAE